MRTITARAFAKINLTLRVLDTRADGYHNIQTVLQSLALHDTLTFRAAGGRFRIECDDPACPTDRTNLVWRAAEQVWRAAGRRGQPRNVIVRIVKRIPLQSGLGGGSSDAAAAMRGLAALWRTRLSRERQQTMAIELGADVPFFLDGGTALGLERGELLFPLIAQPVLWVTLVMPPFGVSTKDAYAWFDRSPRDAGLPAFTRAGKDWRVSARSRRSASRGGGQPRVVRQAHHEMWPSTLPPGELGNDLEPAVAAHHPEIRRLVRGLRRQGASHAGMSGSGSAVFGLFESRDGAEAAARALSARAHRSIVTRTLGRATYRSLSVPTPR